MLIKNCIVSCEYCNFTDNHATKHEDGCGGAIYIENNHKYPTNYLFLNHCNLVNNEAAWYGGAIYSDHSKIMIIGDSHITYNKAAYKK
jgi:hypothetical protein